MSELIFSDRLRALMQERGVNQESLALAAGVSQGAVSGWLKGVSPSADRVVKVARFLNTNSAWLLGDEEEGSKVAEGLGVDWRERAITAEAELRAIKSRLLELGEGTFKGYPKPKPQPKKKGQTP